MLSPALMMKMRYVFTSVLLLGSLYTGNSYAQTEEDFTTISPPLTFNIEKNEEDETFTPKKKKRSYSPNY